MKKFLTIAGASLVANALPLIVAAQAQTQLPPPPITTPGQALNIICVIAGWMFAVLIVLAVVYIILAAFNYLFAGGNPEKVETASKSLIIAAVAIAVALLARAVPLIVSGVIGSSYQGTGC